MDASQTTQKELPDYSRVKIKVSCDCPPIPWRHFDYSAIDDNSFDADWDGERYVTRCPIGHGATETEAIADLLEQMADRDDTDAFQILLEIAHANAQKSKATQAEEDALQRILRLHYETLQAHSKPGV